jgi:hypothetical protein
MSPEIPYDQWNPLSVAEVAETFAEAPFTWGLAGGYCVEQFFGRSIRLHGDIDVVVYRDEQLLVQQWLAGWQLYAADPPGVLRRWHKAEFLPYGIHDIWGHRIGSTAWQMQIMLDEIDGEEWFSRRSAQIRGRRTDLIVHYHGLPCLRIEVQLLYKAKGRRPKDELDFQACLPLLNPAAKCWLEENLRLLYPDGHPWLNVLIAQ